MQFDEKGSMSGKTLMLLPGTACDYQTNFATVLDRLGEKYHLICVNYDGFDGSDAVFPDMITVTEKIERYIQERFGGKLDGALGYSGTLRWEAGRGARLLPGQHLRGAADHAAEGAYRSRYLWQPRPRPERKVKRLAAVEACGAAADQLHRQRKEAGKDPGKAQVIL